MVTCRTVTWMSLVKLWSGFLLKCLYSGRLVRVVLADLCSAILFLSGLAVWPTYWFCFSHYLAF